MKKLKVGDVVNAVFLSEPNECEVIEVINKHVYKLMMKEGTILPNATWKKLLEKPMPWHIVSLVRRGNVKVIKDSKSIRSDLDHAISKQKAFIRGEIKK
jgi:hypothetical protein|tara:strand:+ start:612 stop:908 length:297 start_codon:yes stop_codon:yes gene_type:complete